MAKKQTDRKQVEINRKRIPLRKLMHGKEIREAAKALEDFRLIFNEEEMLYGAKLTVHVEPYGGDFTLVAHRTETDKEYADRLERARIAAEQKAERERKRKLAEAERAKRAEANRKKTAAETIKDIAKKSGISAAELEILLKTFDKTN